MKALNEQGYTTPTPIQAQAIPIVNAGTDLLGIAQTGTGKTAAFALPTLNYLLKDDVAPPKRGTRCLVLAPTRELAGQIAVSFKTYGKYFPHLSVTTIFGGASVRGQIKAVVGGNEVIVATPGRLIDLIEQKALRLSDVEVLILDEADQMMDMGFIHALKKIVPLLPKKRQTLFFSATMPKSISKLAGQFLTNPKTVSITPAATTAERVEQVSYRVNQKEKQALLVLTLNDADYDRALVFSRTKHGADRIVKKLAAAGITSAALHGNKSQGQRQRILDGFRKGTNKVLVATDIAARGIDIDGITHVINFDVPNVADQYVHRIGRTARAGRSGLAISFVSPDEKPFLKDIQKLIKQTLPVLKLPDNFTKSVSEIARLKPVAVPKDPGDHKRSDDPRKNKYKVDPGKDKKRRKNFRKKAESAKADLMGAINPDARPTEGGRPQSSAPHNRRPDSRRPDHARGDKPRDDKPRAPRPGKDTRNPDGSRSERRRRASENAPKSDKRPHGGKPSGGKPSGGRPATNKPSGPKKSNANFKRKTRKAPDSSGNRGGDAPPKRRGSR